MTKELVERLQERAGSYRSSGPSAEDTAILLEEAAAAIIALQGERDHWKAQAANDAASAAIWQDRAEAAEAENERINAGWYHTSKMLGASNARAYEAEAEVARLKAELERLHELDTCMCGSRMDNHDIGSGHSPVSMYDYYRFQDKEEIKRLKDKLAEANRVIEQKGASDE